jgi:Ca2+-binding RTX toxin-like protein
MPIELYERAGSEFTLNGAAGVQSVPKLAWISASRYVAVWTDDPLENNLSNLRIRAQIFEADGTPVGGEFTVNATDVGDQTNAVVTKLSGGGFVIAWEDRNSGTDGSGSAIRYQLYDSAGAAVGGERLANTTATGDQTRPSIAALDGGGFVLTWTDGSMTGADTSFTAVRGQRFEADGDPVGSEFLVNTVTNRVQTASSVVGLPGGGFAVVWQDESPQGVFNGMTSREDRGSDIAVQIFDSSANKVGAQQVVDNTTPSPTYFFGETGGRVTAHNPVAVLLPSGKIAVAWTDSWDGYIKTRQLNLDGTPATGVQIVGEAFGTVAPAPAIVALADGGYAISWTVARPGASDPSGQGLLARVYSADGTAQGAEFQVNSSTSGNQLAPSILAHSDGGFLIAYADSASTDIRAVRFAENAGAIVDISLSVQAISKAAIENVQAANLSADGAVNAPFTYSILSDPTGGAFRIEGDRLVVADTQLLYGFAGNSVTVTFRATDPNGNSFDEAVEIPLSAAPASILYEAGAQFHMANPTPEPGATGAQTPELVALPSGGYFATWVEYRSSTSGFDVMGQFHGADGSHGAAFVVNSVTSGNQFESAAALLQNGNIVVTWAGGTGNFDIKAQILTPTGAKLGGEFFVNTVTAQTQSWATPTALADGGFLVTWADQSLANDTSSTGVKAQFFTAAGAKVGGEFLVNTTTTGSQNQPTAAQLANGTIVVAWQDASATGGDLSGTAIRAQLLSSTGTPIGSEFLVNTTTNHGQQSPVVTALAGGGFVITWRDLSEGTGATGSFDPSDIRAQIYDSDGNPVGGEILVNTETQGSQGQGSLGAAGVAANASGGFVVTWSTFFQANSDGSSGSIKAQIFAGDGSKLGSEFLVNQVGAEQQSTPAVAYLADNDLVFAWWDLSGSRSGESRAISARRFDAAVQANPAYNVIEGTAGPDDLIGTPARDLISGQGGDDFIAGRAEADTLSGGDGNDLLRGEEGNDELSGGAGNDNLRGGSGVDEYDGGGHDSVLNDISTYGDRVSFADDRATQGAVADLRTGQIANDGFGNAETMTGIESLGGGTAFADTFHGNDDVNALLGSRNDQVYGHGGDDIVVSSIAAVADGGAGNDTLWLEAGGGFLVPDSNGDGRAELADAATAGWYVDLQFGFVEDGYLATGSVVGFENVRGSHLADLIIGSSAANVLEGGGGDDDLFARGGNDRAEGGAGDDFVRGEDGDDLLFGGDGDDILRGGAGVDSFDGGAESGVLSNLRSGYGDRVSFVEMRATRGVVADLRTGQILDDGYGNVETMVGIESLGADTAFADTFHGNDNRNFLYAAHGDFLYGYGGDDVISLLGAAAMADGGDGVDTLQLRTQGGLRPDSNGDGNAEIPDDMTTGWTVDLGLGTMTDGYGNNGTVAGIENVTGSSLADRLRGSSANNRIEGGDGNDSLRLQQGGDDSAYGGAGNDSFYFGAAYTAADLIDGGTERDQVALQGNYNLTLGSITGVEDLILLSGSDTRFGDTAGNLYTYVLTSIDANVAAGAKLLIDATMLVAGESATFDGSAETDGKFLFSGGQGNDVFTGGAGADGFYFRDGSFWNPGDKVIGGAGDQIGLRGDFTGAQKIVMGADQIQGVETIVLMSGVDIRFGPIVPPTKFDIVMNDGNLASGRRFTIDGAQLAANETFRLDASAETDGTYRMFGGAGADELIGGANADFLRGGAGADILKGNGGADTFAYRSASESTSTAFDLLVDVKSAEDRIDLHSSVSGWATSITSGQLSHSSFDADLAAALDASLGANQAILFDPTSGDYAGRHFLVVDADGDGAYTAGADYVFELGNAAVIDTSGTGIFA